MIQFDYEGRCYGCNDTETLLDALLRQGADVPHSCGRGSCHTCLLHVDHGEVSATRALDPALAARRLVLPCVSRPAGPGLRIRRPRPDELWIEAEVVARRKLGEGLFALDIAPSRSLDYLAGQTLRVEHPDGLVRPYSIASRATDDYFLTIHVRRIDGGCVSGWLCGLQPGQRLRLQSPSGDCVYSEQMRERPLQMLATGSGAGALAAVAREALEQGHVAGITLYHGVRKRADLYLHHALRELERSYPSFSYRPCVSGEPVVDAAFRGRVVEAAFADASVMRDAELFLCGLPLMVEEARYRARLVGVPADRIHADPFEFAEPRTPRDAEKMQAIQADPEMWAALEHGPGLTRLLHAFYRRVYQDDRLAPFFQQIPLERVATKQYEFLASLFTGTGEYFGLNPYNAHHWMVISDELFDYRETLFEQVLRDHEFPPHLIDRWLALHELFRAEIVKSRARGLITHGVEQPLRSHSLECLDIDAVCDACGAEIRAGEPSRYVFRIGALHCMDCAGIDKDLRGVANG